MTIRDELTELEAMIDRDGLEAVIDRLAGICREKEEHVLSNWQDNRLARQWTKRAVLLDKAVDQVRRLPVA